MLSQLASMYTPAVSRTILSNCDYILYLGSQNVETAKYIAARAVKMPEAILSMPRTKEYLITSGEKARLVDKTVPRSTVAEPAPGAVEAERSGDNDAIKEAVKRALEMMGN